MQQVKTWELLVVLVLCVVCGWTAFEIVGAITMHGLAGWALQRGMTGWAAQVIAHPFAIYSSPLAMMAGVACGVAPLATWAVIISKRGNFDPGKEHGDARLATKREMQAMADGKTITNNIPLTSTAGIVLKPKNASQQRATNGLNHNITCVGTSGTGKTAYVSKPMILNSVGSALRDEANFGGSWPEEDDDEGYDIFCTDPKGDTLSDVGWFLAHAGVNLKVFNTIDFSRSRRYNPLAYIKSYRTDVVNDVAGEIGYTASMYVDGELIAEISSKKGLRERSVNRDGFYLSVIPEIRSEEVSPEPMMRHVDSEGSEDRFFDDETVFSEIKSIVYKRSEVIFKIRFQHRNNTKRNVKIVIELDEKLIPFRSVDAAGVHVEPVSNGGAVCTIAIPAAHRLSPVNSAPYEYRLACKVRSRNVADGVDLTSIVDCLVANLGASKDSANTSDPFWDDAERLFFMAIIAYIIERYGIRWCNLPTVVNYIDLAKVSFDGKGVSPLDCAFDSWESGKKWERSEGAAASIGAQGVVMDAPSGKWVETGFGPHTAEKSLAVHCYKAFKQGAPETLQSIIISCQAACTKLVTEEIRWLLDVDEMELDTLGDAGQKQAIFGIVSDTNPTYEFLLAIMQYQAINIACDKARIMGGKLPRHVHFVLDEFANIGKLPSFDRAISVVRSRNMSVCLFLQTINQLDKVYGEHEGGIIQDNCATYLFLGGQSDKTLESLSKLMGDETVDEVNTSRTYGIHGSSTASRQKVQRPLATISQLRTTPIDEAWVMTIGKHPYRDKKIRLWEHPYFKFIGGFRAEGQAPCVFPQFDYADYREVMAGRMPFPEQRRPDGFSARKMLGAGGISSGDLYGDIAEQEQRRAERA